MSIRVRHCSKSLRIFTDGCYLGLHAMSGNIQAQLTTRDIDAFYQIESMGQ